MNYRKRRNQIGLSVYTVARELGVDYDKYLEVEKGKRPLEQEYVDKFQNIIENATQIKLERAMKMARIRPLFTNGEIKQKIRAYGYTHKELGEILGMTQGNVSNAFSGNPRLTSDDTIERIYDFLNNPFNKKVEKVIEEKPIVSRTKLKNISEEILNWYNGINLREFITSIGKTRKEFAEHLGITPEHLANVINGKRNFSGNIIEKIYLDFVDKIKKEEPIREEISFVPVEKLKEESIETSKDNDDMFTLEELKNIIKENTMLKEKVAYYRKKINLYEKIMEKLV